eukprot:TRINITY_DN170_c1_g2_i4.p1 TRINITY_DN170_c1_g2~~TRINITY_DN170_c1_g2_i4.p1  ORF type:complete len:717 (-),score=174.90 TRINITY_DN170_c1_g2_i4:467-2617(-)
MVETKSPDDPFYFTLAKLTNEYERLKAENEKLKARLENEQPKASGDCELFASEGAEGQRQSSGIYHEDDIATCEEAVQWRQMSGNREEEQEGGLENPSCGSLNLYDMDMRAANDDEDAAPRPVRRFFTEALHAAPGREASKEEAITHPAGNGVGRAVKNGHHHKDEPREESKEELLDRLKQVEEQDDLQKGRSHVFTNLADMKHQVREKVWKKHYDVTDYYHTEGYAQQIARMHVFESFCMFAISVNAVWIAVETDMNDAATLMESNAVFILGEIVFCLVFVTELTIRFAAFAVKKNCLHDSWFMFDLILVSIMVLETFTLPFIFAALELDVSSKSYTNSSILRIARLMKVIRLGRMARVANGLPEIMILIRGLMAAARSVLVTLGLVMGVTYVFAVAFTAMLKDGSARHHIFSSTSRSMQILWTYGALLNDVNQMMAWLQDEGDIMPVLLFNAYILVAALAVMNMLIGVLCNVVSIVAASEKEEAWLSYAKRRLLAVYKDEDKTMTKHEFLQMLQKKECVRTLFDLDVDVVDLVDSADLIFVHDPTNPTHDHKTMTFIDFLDLITGLNGTNPATVKNIVDIRKSLHIAVSKVEKMVLDKQMRMQDGFIKRLEGLRAASDRQEAKAQQTSNEYRRTLDKMTGLFAKHLTNITQILYAHPEIRPPVPLENIVSKIEPHIVEAERDSAYASPPLSPKQPASPTTKKLVAARNRQTSSP